MIVELGPMPFLHAIDMIKWCHARDIDRDRCQRYLDSMSKVGDFDGNWYLDIPDKYMTWFNMKWNLTS